jgi:osmotically-inducible protein OsmY
MDHRKHNLRKSLLCLAFAVALGTSLPTFADSNLEGATRDAWLDGKLEAALLFNPHLDSFAIDTDVHNGVAILSGHVSNDIEKSLAEEIAKSLEGITSVENKIVVGAPDAGTMQARAEHAGDSFKQQVADATLTAKVKTRLVVDDHIAGLKIDVDSHNGAVTLNGTVPTDTERDLAVKITENTDGVASVDNRLVTAGQ